MDRHRGDRYGDSDNNNNNSNSNSESSFQYRHSRALPPPDTSMNQQHSYNRRSPNSYRGGGAREHPPFDSPPPHHRYPAAAADSGGGGGDSGGFNRGGGPREHPAFDGPPAPHRYPAAGADSGGGGGGAGADSGGFNRGGGPRENPAFNGPPPPHRYPAAAGDSGGAGADSGGFNRGGVPREHPVFDGPPPHRYPGAGDSGGVGGDSGGFNSSYQMLAPPPTRPLSGQKRAYGSPERVDGGGFAKLFVGSVPRTATEEDIRPLFEEQGRVLEVALIKDKRTGQQQGCCFIKYATSDEADRAIRLLHNQHTLPGGVGPIQVRYADGERERLGAVEYKLFVGSLNKQATEKEVEEIFSPYGRVQDVYLMRDDMKQSRGCGFVKYSQREIAMEAINSLNGKYTMRGCDQPLTVRFADPKRPRPGEPRGGGPAFGGPGFGPRFPAPGIRPPPNVGEPPREQIRPIAWRPMSPERLGPISNTGMHGYGNQFPPRSTDTTVPSTLGGSFGSVTGSGDGSVARLSTSSTPTSQQSWQQPLTVGSQIAPLQKTLQSPQHVPSSLHLQPPASTPLSQGQTSHALFRQPNQVQMSQPAGQSPYRQGMPLQQSLGLTGQSSLSQPQVQQNMMSSAIGHTPLSNNMQIHAASAMANQQPVQQQLLQPLHQSPSQLAQMLSQQTQTLQASFQSSQKTFTQLQQQLQLMQPSNQSSAVQQGSQEPKQQIKQSPWPGFVPQAMPGATAVQPKAEEIPVTSAAQAASATDRITTPVSSWTEHMSPDGFKYYHNSTTGESKWEKPEELISYEQKQHKPSFQEHKPSFQQPQVQGQSHGFPSRQVLQMQPQLQSQLLPQVQTQVRHPQLLQQASQATPYPVGMTGQQTIQGHQAAQEWMWKNKPAGA